MSNISRVVSTILWLMCIGFAIAIATKAYTPSIESLAYMSLAIILILLGMGSRR